MHSSSSSSSRSGGARHLLVVVAGTAFACSTGLIAECGRALATPTSPRVRGEASRHGKQRHEMEEDLLHQKRSAAAARHHHQLQRKKNAVMVLKDSDSNGASGGVSEEYLIHDIDIPFVQSPEEWEHTGLSLTALGEPKSGTTWLARVIVELSLQLCGNPENAWCQMGGLNVTDRPPAPRYEFEMLHADSVDLFLHFQGVWKHVIPGLEDTEACTGGGISHHNSFENEYPCKGASGLTRAELTACLPTVTPTCAAYLPPLDPAVRRMAVIFRDPRNLIISEHRMRLEVYHQNFKRIGALEPFILGRFDTVVAWIHQRYTWHTTTLKDISHVMFYEDLKENPRHLGELAAFMGLSCTPEEAEDVFQRHAYANPPGDYNTYGLSFGTLEWMNATMSKVLPEVMVTRYGLTAM